MPIYEYGCQGCGRKFEYQQRMADDPKTTCEECGGALERLISATSFHLKGGGWYKDLYSSVPSAGGGTSESSPAGGTSANGASSDSSSTSSTSSDSASPSGATTAPTKAEPKPKAEAKPKATVKGND